MLTTRSLFLFTIFTVLFTCRGDSTEGTGVAPPGDVAIAAPGSEASEKAGDSENSHPAPEAFESKESKDSAASAASAAAPAAPVAAPQLRSGWGHGRHPGSWSPRSPNDRRPMPKPLKNHAMGPRR